MFLASSFYTSHLYILHSLLTFLALYSLAFDLQCHMHSLLYIEPFVFTAFCTFVLLTIEPFVFTAFCTFVLLTITPSALSIYPYIIILQFFSFIFYLWPCCRQQKLYRAFRKNSLDTASFEPFYILLYNLLLKSHNLLSKTCPRMSSKG